MRIVIEPKMACGTEDHHVAVPIAAIDACLASHPGASEFDVGTGTGVLAPQKAEVEAAYRAQGLIPEAGAAQGEWVRLDFHR